MVGFKVGTICFWRVWRVWRVWRRNEREAALVFRVKRRDSRGDDDGLRRDCRAAGTRDERRRRDERGTRARFRSVRNVFGGANAFRGARFGTKRARRGGRLGGFRARHDTRGGGPVPVTRDENARVRPRRRYVNVKIYHLPAANDATGRVDRFRSFVNVSCAYRYYYTSWTMLNGDARGSSSAYPTFERSSKVGHRRERLSRRSILHLVTVP